MDVDVQLIRQANRLITAANVHTVKMWIYCYEHSDSSSPRRIQFENLLRDFVKTQRRVRCAQQQAENARDYAAAVRGRSDTLNRQLDQLSHVVKSSS